MDWPVASGPVHFHCLLKNPQSLFPDHLLWWTFPFCLSLSHLALLLLFSPLAPYEDTCSLSAQTLTCCSLLFICFWSFLMLCTHLWKASLLGFCKKWIHLRARCWKRKLHFGNDCLRVTRVLRTLLTGRTLWFRVISLEFMECIKKVSSRVKF